MSRSSPLPEEIRTAILNRFRISYSLLTGLFAILSIGILAWQWNQPGDYDIGVPYTRSLPILLIAAILANSVSFISRIVTFAGCCNERTLLQSFTLSILPCAFISTIL